MRRVYPTAKPYQSYPLSPRKDGRFGKKIRGVYYVYGRNGDHAAALQEYLTTAAARHAGRPFAPTAPSSVVTVKQISNRYLAVRERDVADQTLALRTWEDYRFALSLFVKFVGAGTPAAEITSDTFARFGDTLRGRFGHYAYNRTRALVLAWFRYAVAAEWIKPVNFGVGFRKVPAGKIREDRKLRLFSAAEVAKLLELAAPQLRAMILLGLNGGFGATDCANLTRDKIDLKAGVIRYRRAKTNIARTVPLWPETVKALRPLLAKRPNDTLVFRTRQGNAWVRVAKTKKGKVVPKDSVANAFAKLMDAAGIDMPGVGFYGLRHTFATHANEVRDVDARRHIMGRALPDLDDVYVEAFFIERLRAVTDHVRSRVLHSSTSRSSSKSSSSKSRRRSQSAQPSHSTSPKLPHTQRSPPQ